VAAQAEIFRLDALQERFESPGCRSPVSPARDLLRTEGKRSVTAADVEALASWDAKAQPSKEIAFSRRAC